MRKQIVVKNSIENIKNIESQLLTIEDLSIKNPSEEDVRAVAEATAAEGETIHSTWFPITVDAVEAAIWAADALGAQYKKEDK